MLTAWSEVSLRGPLMTGHTGPHRDCGPDLFCAVGAGRWSARKSNEQCQAPLLLLTLVALPADLMDPAGRASVPSRVLHLNTDPCIATGAEAVFQNAGGIHVARTCSCPLSPRHVVGTAASHLQPRSHPQPFSWGSGCAQAGPGLTSLPFAHKGRLDASAISQADSISTHR